MSSGLGTYSTSARRNAMKFRAYSQLAKTSDLKSRRADAIGDAVRSRDHGIFRALDVLVQAEREVEAQMLGVASQIKMLKREFMGLRSVYLRRRAQIVALKRKLGVNRQLADKLDKVKMVERARQYTASGAAASAQSRVQSIRAAIPVPLPRRQ